MKNKLFYPIIIASIIGIGGFGLTSFINAKVHENTQDNSIRHLNKEIHQTDSVCTVKNINSNKRIDKNNDINRIDHKELNNKIDNLEAIIIRIDENIKYIKRESNIAVK